MSTRTDTNDDDGRSLPQRRGLLTYFFDRIVMWFLGFPPERCTYTTQGVCIPISEGLNRIELAANLLRPVLPGGESPRGTVLQISPYGRGLPIGLSSNAYAARGYQVLMVSSRGTFGSGGSFDPFRNEVEDGKAVVEWMRAQPWYTGTFATIGGSYLSFTQWGLMVNAPEDMVAAVATVSLHDGSRAMWDAGALNLDLVRWAGGIATQEESSLTWKAVTRPKFEPVIRRVPLAHNVRQYLGDNCRWLDHMIAESDMSHSYYRPMQLEKALERVNVPILIVTGWHDIFLKQSIEQYIRLKERGVSVALTSGPWSHIKCAMSHKAHRSGFDWIEEHLGGETEAKRKFPVEFFVTGAQEWRQADTWPPPCKPSTLYLQVGGKLTEELQASCSGSSMFYFNPREPTPTLGGNALLSLGPVNDSALAKRKDVLTFDSEVLENEFEFCGQAVIELEHSTSHPHADVFVRISAVKADGRSVNVTEGYKRLDPERDQDETVRLTFNNASHRFLRGRRIRVLIAGGNFPQYTRNLGVDDQSNNESEMQTVLHTITFSAAHVSKVTFPRVLSC